MTERVTDAKADLAKQLAERTARMKTTPEMRARIRELSAPERDDFDRAVLELLDDFEAVAPPKWAPTHIFHGRPVQLVSPCSIYSPEGNMWTGAFICETEDSFRTAVPARVWYREAKQLAAGPLPVNGEARDAEDHRP